MKIDELEEVVAESSEGSDVLRDVLYELQFRESKARVEALKARCGELLAAIASQAQRAPPQEPPRPTTPPEAPRIPTPDTSQPIQAEADLSPLGRMRRKLLDLSSGNRLLRFTHYAGTSVRVVDEIPSLVFDEVTEGREMTFEPVIGDAEDEVEAEELPLLVAAEAVESRRQRGESRTRAARQAARAAGINTSWDLPATAEATARQHRDTKIQTLLFPEDLEAVLRRLDQKARTARNETGANMLHLMFGFVEWLEVPVEQADESSYRAAPLVLVPVSIRKGDVDNRTGCRRYTVTSSGEAWATNVTLEEKCRSELGHTFPRKKDEEALEDYFSRVSAWLARHTNGWRLRRHVTMGLASFGKILMWRDLDPAAWPPDADIREHPLVRLFLGAAAAEDAGLSGAGSDAEERVLRGEGLPEVAVDADSTQHAVLVDVAAGKNLVVEGPPGTGKSQTIANIIASALSSKKTVLFVAEKKAALDVVFKRLDAIGIGDFCLALHSHTSQKKEFLEELERRLQLTVPRPRASVHDIRQEMEGAQRKLNDHVRRLHAKLEPLGMSCYEVFGRARRLVDGLSQPSRTAISELRLSAAHQMTRGQLESAASAVEEFARVCRDLFPEGPLRLETHPWWGVEGESLTQEALDRLLDNAKVWRSRLRSAEDAVKTLSSMELDTSCQSLESIRELHRALAATEPHPSLEHSSLSGKVLASGRAEHFIEAVAAIEGVGAAWAAVDGRWSVGRGTEPAVWQEREATVAKATISLGVSTTWDSIRATAARARALRASVEALRPFATQAQRLLRVQEELTPQVVGVLNGLLDRAALMTQDAFELRSERLQDPGAEGHITQLSSEASLLREGRAKQDGLFPPATRPTHGALIAMVEAVSTAPRLFPWLLSARYRKAFSDFRLATGRRERRDDVEKQLRQLLAHQIAEEAFAGSSDLGLHLGAKARGADSPFGDALDAVRWHHALSEAAGGLGTLSASLLHAGWTVDRKEWMELLALRASLPANSVQTCLGGLEALERELAVEEGTLVGCPVSQAISKIGDVVAASDRVEGVFESAGCSGAGTLGNLTQRLRAVADARVKTAAVGPHEALVGTLSVSPGDPGALGVLRAAAQYVISLRESSPASFQRWLCGDERVVSRRASALVALERAEGLATLAGEQGDKFGKLGGVVWSKWLTGAEATSGSPARSPLPRLLERLERALADESALYGLARYLRARAEAARQGGGTICDVVEAGEVPPAEAKAAFEAAAYTTAANGLLRKDPELDRFSGIGHERVREEFAERDHLLQDAFVKTLRFELATAPGFSGVGTGPVDDMTDEGLIRHYARRPRGRITIRQIFERAGRALSVLKPCFMMSPQAIAQFLPPGRFTFDLVVMDEASQIKPEDALAAIARGEQVVVVGDQKQLGPSTYFEKQVFDTDEDVEVTEEAVPTADPRPTDVDKAESILAAAAARFPSRMLKWHYRSRHPKLIEFSNCEFYNKQLVVFPTPTDKVATDGVFLTRVENAVYSGQRNAVEAMAVVEAVRRHARERPSQSLLVATLNFKQADLVDELLDRAEKEDSALEAFRQRWDATPEPLDVKNLENVQGDERDAIVVSLTHGPDEAGRFHRRFGPINASGGERRLNVLFTRAKHRLDVFCSFDPRAIGSGPTSPKGVAVLERYLHYAADGEWARGSRDEREPDSDFEIAVAEALRRLGMEVHHQVGVRGYFIDLAVVDPRAPGTYLLGIECDGATYHSGRSARDRDRLRQRVLEAYNWRIHRIWSTDWFREPHREAERVLARVRSLTGNERFMGADA